MAPINQPPPHHGFNKRALLIAVRDIKVRGFPILHNAHRNAKELQRLLIDKFGYSPDKVVVMMDRKGVDKELWPTLSNIKKQIQRFVRGVSPGDHLFFYYSGHGHQVTCDHHTETDGLDEVIYACTGRHIKDNDLKKILVNPLPSGCKLFALWDSCHSKTILDLDHHSCNEPGCDAGLVPTVRKGLSNVPQAILKMHFPRSKQHALSDSITSKPRGRPVARGSVTITALSTEASPSRSKWIPFTEAFSGSLQRYLSPQSWFKCDGKCEMPKEGGKDRAHVISLSACKDNEMAFDDNAKNETVTTFFVDHLRKNPESTLLELLSSIRERVEKICERRQEWAMQTRVISRRATCAEVSETDKKPPPVRRNTEIHVQTLEEYLRAMMPSTQGGDESDASTLNHSSYSQKPGVRNFFFASRLNAYVWFAAPQYASHYKLDLGELVDL
ncbi:hypothetical protein HYDPIDRAFT_31169 [Hydnomerulius pinastri MD-312]|uniref:Peptidase C14 caspase domain-containing protein n=1 Tax=Hydnomerulius pinastri MD-312 TaxID=994086 RepID=A0A0C9WBW4_9AGAM|nr:hypothetical protein HYDPIDRAFT_31169 [Hydnomerulius pinastri MD-312]